MKPTIEQITGYLKGLPEDQIARVFKIVKRAYEKGSRDLLADEDFEIEDPTREQIGVTYSTEAYKDCRTLEEFQEKYREIESRSFNFM